jgi:hypothetical protein
MPGEQSCRCKGLVKTGARQVLYSTAVSMVLCCGVFVVLECDWVRAHEAPDALLGLLAAAASEGADNGWGRRAVT